MMVSNAIIITVVIVINHTDDRFKEALSLIKAHHLYALGLELYSTQPEQYVVIYQDGDSNYLVLIRQLLMLLEATWLLRNISKKLS